MAAKGTFAHVRSRARGSAADAAIVAEGVSKRYPGIPDTLFPPIVSMFDRGWFGRKRSSVDKLWERGSADGQKPRADAEGERGRSSADDRRRRTAAYDDLDQDDEDLDDEEQEDADEADFERNIPVRPGPFWALKEVSFRVPPGGALGVLGGPESGKSTLLRILSGGAPPTEGRVMIRDPVSPLPAELMKALAYTSRGTHAFNLVHGCRTLGIPGHLVKRHRLEMVELARPRPDHDGNPDPASMRRLAVATAVVLPWSVILLEEPLTRADDPLAEAFAADVFSRVQERVRSGSSLVLASRNPAAVQELCDEVIVLDEGSIIDRGRAKGVMGRYDPAQGAKQAASGPGSAKLVGPSQGLSQGQEVSVPPVVPAFNASAALHAASLRTASGRSKQIDAAADEVWVEIRFGTARPDVEAHCGVGLTPRGDEETGIRFELPEPLKFVKPRTYVLAGRVPPGTLRPGVYDVRADAVVSNPDEPGASVIASKIGRVRIVGNDSGPPEPDEPPAPHWDGTVSWRAEAEWSVE